MARAVLEIRFGTVEANQRLCGAEGECHADEVRKLQFEEEQLELEEQQQQERIEQERLKQEEISPAEAA